MLGSSGRVCLGLAFLAAYIHTDSFGQFWFRCDGSCLDRLNSFALAPHFWHNHPTVLSGFLGFPRNRSESFDSFDCILLVCDLRRDRDRDHLVYSWPLRVFLKSSSVTPAPPPNRTVPTLARLSSRARCLEGLCMSQRMFVSEKRLFCNSVADLSRFCN